MNEEFKHSFRVSLHETDAAGLIFFGQVFHRAQEAIESLMFKVGMPLESLLADQEILLPVVHSEADYRQPLRLGDEVDIRVSLTRVGDKSVAFQYDFRVKGCSHVLVQTIHACIDPRTGKSRLLPESLRARLNPP